jgi:predicted esterase YcpF (UPF0227 family)
MTQKLNILYLHGYEANFDLNSSKNIELQKIGNVIGYDIDYKNGATEIILEAVRFAEKEKVDIIVGNSMGGWLAAHVGCITGIHFLSCNPSLAPYYSFIKLIKDLEPYFPSSEIKTNLLSDSDNYSCLYNACNSYIGLNYPTFIPSNLGLIALDLNDELINAHHTFNTMNGISGIVKIHTFDGGSHSFEHMENMLPHINNLVGNNKYNI